MLSESDQIDIELKMNRHCYKSIIRGTQIFLWCIKLSSVEIHGIYVRHDMDISRGLYTVSGRVRVTPALRFYLKLSSFNYLRPLHLNI